MPLILSSKPHTVLLHYHLDLESPTSYTVLNIYLNMSLIQVPEKKSSSNYSPNFLHIQNYDDFHYRSKDFFFF